MSKSVSFGQFSFESVAATEEAIREVMGKYAIKTPIRDTDDHEIIEALFEHHPSYQQKLAGRTLSHFEIHPNIGGSHCIYAVFSDGSKIDFSFRKAIKANTRR